MTRSVTDAAILLGVLADTEPQQMTDYTQSLVADGLRGALARAFFGFHERVDAVLGEALAAMRAAGAELIDVDLERGAAYSENEFEVLLYEFNDGHGAYLQGLGQDAPVRSGTLSPSTKTTPNTSCPTSVKDICCKPS